jgi:glutaminyl-tRNA synthetase
VIDPLKITITNYDPDKVEYLPAVNNTENEELGSHDIPFTREIYIEREDFMEVPPNKKYRRLSPGVEVRLMHAYFVRCEEVIKDENGQVIELKCTYDPATKSGSGFSERKPKGTIHWVSASRGVPAEIHMYDRLFVEDEDSEDSALVFNENSKLVYPNAMIEPIVSEYHVEDKFQFVRHGYFNIDPKETTESKLVLNLAVSLKSSYK